VIYNVGEYGLGRFSERFTVSCLASPRLGKGAYPALRVLHPDWVKPNDNSPPHLRLVWSRLAQLLNLSHRASGAALGAIREIASENDRRFA